MVNTMITPFIPSNKKIKKEPIRRYKAKIVETQDGKTIISVFDSERNKEILHVSSDRTIDAATKYVHKMFARKQTTLSIEKSNEPSKPRIMKQLDLALNEPVIKESEYITFIRQITTLVDKHKVPFQLKFRKEEDVYIVDFYDGIESYSHIEKDGASYRYIHCGKLEKKTKILNEIFE